MKCFRFDSLRPATRQRRLLALIPRARFFQTTNPSAEIDARQASESLRLLNKSLYDASVKCHRLGWYARRNMLPSDRVDLAKDSMKEFLIRQGVAFEKYVYGHKYGYHDPDTNENKGSSDNHNPSLHSQPDNLAIVYQKSPIEAAEATDILMNPSKTEDSIDIILQPTFLCGNKVARADVAVRAKDSSDDSWEILEIKSSTEKSFRKKVPDLAYTVSLARSTGYHVSKASLIVVNPNYIRKNTGASLEQDDNSTRDTTLLYKTIDCTKLVNDYILGNKLDKEADVIDEITSGDLPPVEYKLACGKCELLGVECGPRSSADTKSSNKRDCEEAGATTRVLPLEHGIWELPRLSQKQFPNVLERALPTLELRDLDLTPDESSLFLLTKNQIKFFHAVAKNAVVVDHEELGKRLRSIANDGPCTMYLDFEAVSVLNPPYPGMFPYETMITQYSLHKQSPTSNMENNTDYRLFHSEYLSDPQKDCRKELLEHLLDNLGYGKSPPNSDQRMSLGNGPILVYSSYEKTQLKKLATMFPEYSKFIQDIVDHRLVDLEKIIKDCVSHPGFYGRSSIKVTLPALVPGFEQAYQDLLKRNYTQGSGIADGGTASAAFADLISGVRSEALEVERTRTALLEYCKLDTLALVEIHKALWKLIEGQPITYELATNGLQSKAKTTECL